MSDLISRADAIEAVVCHIWHTPPEARKLFNCENYVRDVVEEALKSLPSAKYSKPLQTTLNGDLVSREDALMELNGVCSNWQDDAKVAEIIHALPSAELTLQTPQTYGKGINPSNAEVVEDYISRADAIEAVNMLDIFPPTKDTVARELMALPSAEAEKTYIGIDIPYGSDKGIATIFKRKDDKLILEEVKELMRSWIPCSERLPEYRKTVLISTFWGVKTGYLDSTEAYGDFWEIIEEDGTAALHSIYAWKPLPDPYREDGEV